MPLTSDPALFRRAVRLGERALALHTFGHMPRGQAECLVEPGGAYPTTCSYEPQRELLRVGDGRFGPITRETWNYSVSGLHVLPAWLRRRLPRTGKSPLDAIGPCAWNSVLTRELLELVWVLEHTHAIEPLLDAVLDEIVSGSDRETRTSRAVQQGPDTVGL